MRLNRYPYELTEQDEPQRRGDSAASSLRPLATDLGLPTPTGSRGRLPLFFAGIVFGVASALSVAVWGARTHRWQLVTPEVRTSAAASPVESCPPAAVPQPLVCPPIPAVSASEGSASAAADAKYAAEAATKAKKAKKRHHSVRSAATLPEQSADPPGPAPEVQAETELSNWLK